MRTRSRLPTAKRKTVKRLIHLAICFPNPIVFPSNNAVFDRDKSLLSLEAMIAPLNPIKRVRCDTNVWDAGIFGKFEIKGRIISLITKSEKGRATNKMNIMHAA